MIRFRSCTKCGGDVDLDHGSCIQCGREVKGTVNTYLPMLAKLCPEPFDSEDYIYEPKLDGIRCIAYVDHGSVRLINRSGNDVTGRFPEIRVKLNAPHHSAVLDGELICYDDDGRPNFQYMQSRMNRKHMIDRMSDVYPANLVFFDIMELDGEVLIKKPLLARKTLLFGVVDDNATCSVNNYQIGGGLALLNRYSEKGWEGIMAKVSKGRYWPGERKDTWLKMKARKTVNVVVGGFTVGMGKRTDYFGALMVGKSTPGGLDYMGEVGTGYSDADLSMFIEALIATKTTKCPFLAIPPSVGYYVEPRITVKVSYLELTSTGIMRHPSFEEVVDVNTD